MEVATKPRKATKSHKASNPAVQKAIDPVQLEASLFSEAERQLVDGIIHWNKFALLKSIRLSNATYAKVTYSGSGDSGSAPEFESDCEGLAEQPLHILNLSRHFANNNWVLDVSSQSTTVSHAAEVLCETLIERHHRGYENNDGGCGEVVFHPASMRVEMTCTDYFMDSSSTQYTV